MTGQTFRITILARMLDHGGAQRQLVDLAAGLRARGHEVHVVLFYSGGDLEPELLGREVPVHHLGKSGRWDIIGFLGRLIATLHHLRPDLLYSFLDVPNILAAVLCRVAGRPRLVWSIRAAYVETDDDDWLGRAIPWLEARLSGLADRVITNSQAGARWAVSRGFPRESLWVVENGIDTARFKPDPQAGQAVRAGWGVAAGERLIGLVARLDPMKDHPMFLHACARFAASHADARFVCVGDGPAAYRAELMDFGKRLGISQRLIWAGDRSDMRAVYNALDMLCSSSAWGEGFSNVIGEAMACGKPCVVTGVGDSARIVARLGEVVPPRDPEAMAGAMARLFARCKREPDLPVRLGRRILDEFSLPRMVMRSEQVFGELVDEVRAGNCRVSRGAAAGNDGV